MSFHAELSIDDKIFVVKDFYFSIVRRSTVKGQPDGPPTWQMNLTIDVINETLLTKWMIDPQKKMDGKLTIFKTDGESSLKKYEFKQSGCYKLQDHFIPSLGEATSFMVICGNQIDIGNASFPSEQR